MVIQNATPMIKFSVLELVIDSEQITSETNYDPYSGSIAGGSTTPTVPNSAQTNNCPYPTDTDDGRNIPSMGAHRLSTKCNSGSKDDTSSSVDEGPDIEVELTMEEIENEIGVQEILKEWRMSIPFINRGMQHPCASFNSQEPMPYKDRVFFGTPRRLDEPLFEDQKFASKEHLKKQFLNFT